MQGRGRRARTPGATRELAPIYKRLPHGPHRLEREQVAQHQRARIHGAMIEAIAERGYAETSVKQVVALAGVSRRSFYELFANKQECFLATFDVLAQREIGRARDAYMNAGGGFERRLGAAFGRLAASAESDRNALRLLFVEAQSIGGPGALRLRRASAACEQLLALSFHDGPAAGALPTPIVRAITGGLHASVSRLLCSAPVADAPALAENMLDWTLLFQTERAAVFATAISERASARVRLLSIEASRRPSAAARTSGDERRRLLSCVLRLASQDCFDDLTAAQIADESGVSVDAFFEHFDGRDACFLAALDMIGAELLTIVAAAAATQHDWALSVRCALRALLAHLALNPVYGRALAQEAFSAGPAAAERSLALARSLVALLTEGASAPAGSDFVVEGIAGALWHTIRCQVSGGRVPLLAALDDYLAFIVLAPFTGADAASEILTAPAPGP
ncbi:MAG TPA: TetR/AcrR family transcriptional regulator [Solirubrobacteraceae bacterium]|jgi:AcrR family transcriptional regulator|nr:TetR/AcrR family transcriptional regulator [Solirubrobacteraceae bacterium]